MQNRSPLKFFLLSFLLAIPCWGLGAATHIQLMPRLPIAALAAFCPAIAALILVYAEGGTAGVHQLLARTFDYRLSVHNAAWLAPIVLLMPGAMSLSYGLMRLNGVSIPPPQFSFQAVALLSLAFFCAALGEELGWSGYAIDPMQARWGALRASIVVGVVWAVYHFVALTQADRSAIWIAWWSLGTVAVRVIMVWLYNNTGRSVFAAALFHTTVNVTWQLFPVRGSYYDPRITSLLLLLIAAIIVAISRWSRKT